MKTEMDRLLSVPEKLQKAWRGSSLCVTDKKRIVRCFAEDVTLNMIGDEIHIGIRFKGGLTESIIVPRPLRVQEQRVTNPKTVEYIREASKAHTAAEIAEQLNGMGERTSYGLKYTPVGVRQLQSYNGIPSLKKHLCSLGYLTTDEKAKQMGISARLLRHLRSNGSFTGVYVKTSGRGDYVFLP